MIKSPQGRSLRDRAEARLAKHPVEELHPSAEEAQRLIHELRVHQIELELQNEELRDAQQELALSRDRYRDLYDYAPVGYLTLSTDGLIVQANLTCERILGLTRDALLRQPFTQFVAPDEQDAYHFFRQRLLNADRNMAGTIELRMARADGTTFWARLDVAKAISPTAHAGEQQAGSLVTLTDVTQVHTLQEQEQRMLYSVAHDLRAPATIIKGYLPFLLDLLPEDTLSDHARDIIAAIQRGLHRMDIMLNDLTEATYLQSGQLSIEREPVRLHAYLHEMQEHYAGVLETSRIRLEIPPDLPPVLADPNRLERIFLNLLQNAQKYSDASSPIRVHAQQQGAEIIIAVADQGRGIARADISHLFELFYRVEQGRKAEGIGLGLYITWKLVVAHGGRIWVESELGKGSTFFFSLPVA